MSEDSRQELSLQGESNRRQVLGDKYVDNAMKKSSPFNADMQKLLNEYCWGWCWSRETLTRRERSMLNLAMLTALGKQHEVAVHTRGAKNNGLSDEEIAEVFLQAAVYCGVPAAVDSFRTASQVLAEMATEQEATEK
jgi:4-carboxymuconolactone decarboxylase